MLLLHPAGCLAAICVVGPPPALYSLHEERTMPWLPQKIFCRYDICVEPQRTERGTMRFSLLRRCGQS